MCVRVCVCCVCLCVCGVCVCVCVCVCVGAGLRARNLTFGYLRQLGQEVFLIRATWATRARSPFASAAILKWRFLGLIRAIIHNFLCAKCVELHFGKNSDFTVTSGLVT